jgi:hypothetical protein
MTARCAMQITIAAFSVACQIACNHSTSPTPVPADPIDVITMAVGVEGTVEVASRQEFEIRYRFTP